MDRKDAPTVTLRFGSEEEKERFLGGLSDGWGENAAYLSYPWRQGLALNTTPVIDVRNIDPDEPEDDGGAYEAWEAQAAAWQAEDLAERREE